MTFRFTDKALRDYNALSPILQARVDKQLGLLLENLRHPSLRAKKYDEARDIWQGRVNQAYRFYFQILGDTYEILTIIPHPK
jgi:mRNA-degrading endonuclease RelE of RelBE toxin-antitoxin system